MEHLGLCHEEIGNPIYAEVSIDHEVSECATSIPGSSQDVLRTDFRVSEQVRLTMANREMAWGAPRKVVFPMADSSRPCARSICDFRQSVRHENDQPAGQFYVILHHVQQFRSHVMFKSSAAS